MVDSFQIVADFFFNLYWPIICLIYLLWIELTFFKLNFIFNFLFYMIYFILKLTFFKIGPDLFKIADKTV